MAALNHVKGLPELSALVQRVPRDVKKSALPKGPAAASRFLRDKVRIAAPLGKKSHVRARGVVVPPGTLKRAIINVKKREDSTETQTVYKVTARQGKGAQSRI